MRDTVNLQALIDATPYGGTLELDSDRTYIITRAGSSAFGLNIGDGKRMTIDARGATLVRSGDNAAWSALLVAGSECVVHNMRVLPGLDDQAAEHAHGIFWSGAYGVMDGVTTEGLPGDGIYVYTGANYLRLVDCNSRGNGRNSLTLGGDITGASVLGGVYSGSRAQQIDVEPGNGHTVNELLLHRVAMEAGASDDYVLTLGDHGRNHRLINCHINGGIYAPWASGISILGCYGINATDKPSLTIEYASDDVLVKGFTTSFSRAKRGIWMVSTGPGNSPQNIRILDSYIYSNKLGAPPIELSGVRDTDIDNCVLVGQGSAWARGGVMIRATNVNEAMEQVRLSRTEIASCGDFAVMVGGASEMVGDVTLRSQLKRLMITDCEFQYSRYDVAMDNTVQQYISHNNAKTTDMLTGIPCSPVSQLTF
jgi:hypothetical protein